MGYISDSKLAKEYLQHRSLCNTMELYSHIGDDLMRMMVSRQAEFIVGCLDGVGTGMVEWNGN